MECCNGSHDLQHLCGDDCTLRKVSGHVAAGAERPAGDIWHDSFFDLIFPKEATVGPTNLPIK